MRDRTADVRESGFADVVLVCTNGRDSEYACCADAGGPAAYEAVRSWLRDRGLFWSHVSLVETSCLGLCSAEGAAVGIQPRDRWYSDVRPGDVPDLLGEEFGDVGSDAGATASSRRDDGPPAGGRNEPGRGRQST